MIDQAITELVQYGLDTGLVAPEDKIFVTNQILEALGLESYEETPGSRGAEELEQILKEITDYAVEKELIADKIHKLKLLLNEKDQDLPYSLSVSSGYAYYHPDTDMDFKDIVRRSDTMLYREKRRKKISHSASSHPMLSSGKQSRAQGITDELITQEKKYQHISPTELCGIIDLLSPSTDDYLYLSLIHI